MTQVSTAVNKLADQKVWMEALYVLVGYLVPMVAETTTESAISMDVPGEVYGAGSMVGGYYVLSQGKIRRNVVAGSGVYVLERLAERAGLKDTLDSTLGGN